MNKFQLYGFKIAELTSELSKDCHKKVGAAILNPDWRLVSTGYNGFPSGVRDKTFDVENRLALTVHAEINAIISAKQDLSDCRIFIYPCLPCSQCAGAIVQAGITEVYVWEDYHNPKWNTKLSLDIFEQAGVKLICGNTLL